MSHIGKTILITGAAGGLGRTIAETFLSKGANVVICDINRERLAAASQDLLLLAGASNNNNKYHADRALLLEADVTDEESVRELVAAAVAKFGRLDVVVNNAGIMDRLDPAGSCDAALWDRVMAVNTRGPFLLTKHVVPYMEAQAKARTKAVNGGDGHGESNGNCNGHTNGNSNGTANGHTNGNGNGHTNGNSNGTSNGNNSSHHKDGGLIVNIASVASSRGILAGAAYTTSKHAILGLTRHTASYYGRKGIYAVALQLGGMDTNIADAMRNGVNEEGLSAQMGVLPEYELVPTEHIARYICFLSENGFARTANGGCVLLSSNCPLV